MTIDPTALIFFDSSCLIAAAGSPAGGSSFLLSLCARKYFRAAVSQPVLLETQRNIQARFGADAINRFYNLLAVVPFILAILPDENELKRIEKAVNKKDVHVVAAALAVNASFLLTLDKGLAHEVEQASFGIRAFVPGDFIKLVLPKHVDYPSESV
jgi:predicted nucleic acid-binding protein